MKELILNNMDFIVSLITMGVTWFLGWLTKKNKKLSNQLIPYQNIIIGIIVTIVYKLITGDWSMPVASSTAVATLLYDAKHTSTKEKFEEYEDAGDDEDEYVD